MKKILILGAGFGGLELSSILSEELGDAVDVTLIDQNDSFVFGYSKLDVMFGKETPEAVRLPYRKFTKPGVRVLRQTVTKIDPATRKVTTDAGVFEADILVVALGVDYDLDATPGLRESGNEFYSFAGAEKLRGILPTFSKGRVVIGVAGAPFKCPPAPSEAALMLHDMLSTRGVRENCEITFVMPLPSPVPPSPETSRALLAAFAERKITFMPGRKVVSLDGKRKVVILDDGQELPYDLYMGVPKHRAAKVVEECGLSEDGWIPVDDFTLATRFPGVYAIGDCADSNMPRAGVFAEAGAKAVASALIAQIRGTSDAKPCTGTGICYIEFGKDQIGRVEVNFYAGPKPTGVYSAPSVELRTEKKLFGSSRRKRWFGL